MSNSNITGGEFNFLALPKISDFSSFSIENKNSSMLCTSSSVGDLRVVVVVACEMSVS